MMSHYLSLVDQRQSHFLGCGTRKTQSHLDRATLICSTELLDSRVFQISNQVFDFVFPFHQVLDQSQTLLRVLKSISGILFHSICLLLVPGIEERQEGDSETSTQHNITSSQTHTKDSLFSQSVCSQHQRRDWVRIIRGISSRNLLRTKQHQQV